MSVVRMVAILIAATVIAASAQANKKTAQAFYKKGMAFFLIEKYDLAIPQFEAGFAEEPLPAFLFNIAQSHRKAGRWEMAKVYYGKFLDLSPDSSDRGEVEQAIRDCDAEIGKMRAMAMKDPVAPPKLVPVVAAPPPKVEAPRRRVWPIVVGVLGGVIVVGGVTAGAVVAGEPTEPVLPAWNPNQ